MPATRRVGLLVLVQLGVAGCTSDADFDRIVEALSPGSGFGSSRQLISPGSTLAPSTGLTMRRVADDGAGQLGQPIRPESGDVWPTFQARQNTLADFERSLHDGTEAPPVPRTPTP